MTLLDTSRSLWNRRRFELQSDEVLAQVLDRGDMRDWRELFRLACQDAGVRRRIHQIVLTVPIALPHFWLVALRSAGEDVDLDAELPSYHSGI